MTDAPKEKLPLLTHLHVAGGGLMIIGSPFVALWNLGAAIMFLIVGLLWLGLTGFIISKKEEKKKEASKAGLKVVA